MNADEVFRAAEARTRGYRVPGATYRVQLFPGFGFEDAVVAARYANDLGADTLYLPPIAEAQPGSPHGYDIVDPTRIRAELGGEPGFRRLSAAAADLNMGILLDIVPNHMSIGRGNNDYWNAVLRGGPDAPEAALFDVAWRPGPTRLQVLLPVLAEPYQTALSASSLRLASEGGDWQIRYHDQWFPLATDTVALAEDVQAGRATLSALLDRQWYRLASWRLSAEHINYRRFADVNDLAALRVQDPVPFDLAHALPLRLLANGLIHGLRVDHIDGLAQPARYLERLHAAIFREHARAAAGALWERVENPVMDRYFESPFKAAYVVVEKVLAAEERLPDGWMCEGTTGYAALAAIDRSAADQAGLQRLRRRASLPIEESRLVAKRQALIFALANEIEWLGTQIAAWPPAEARAHDISASALRHAVREIVVQMDRYRTYLDVRVGTADPDERALLDAAVSRAQIANPAVAHEVFDLVRRVLVGPLHADSMRAAIVERFQQACAAAMAKGEEDTLFYRETAVLAFCEVGNAPEAERLDASRFHARARDWSPRGLIATSTHDTKRSSAARSVLLALTHHPRLAADLRARAAGWAGTESGGAPDAIDRQLLAECVLATWPGGREVDDVYRQRILTYAIKALREGKRHSSWLNPAEAYESAATDFALSLMCEPRSVALLDEAEATLRPTALSIAARQALLRIAAPGIPDTYGAEPHWDRSLVDPDNRRALDFPAMRRRLPSVGDAIAAFPPVEPGTWLESVTSRLLWARRDFPDVFAFGSYEPIRVTRGAIAFLRESGNRAAFAAAGHPAHAARGSVRLGRGLTLVGVNRVTGDDVVISPAGVPLGDLLCGQPIAMIVGALEVAP